MANTLFRANFEERGMPYPVFSDACRAMRLKKEVSHILDASAYRLNVDETP